MATLADRSWSDRNENYADGYARAITLSTAENLIGIDIAAPVVVYSVTLSVSQANASGLLSLVDSSATADAGTAKVNFVVASGGTTERDLGSVHAAFPRGIVFDNGVIVSGTTVTGYVTITYKRRSY